MAADERMLHVLIKSCPLEDGDAAAWARRLLAALREERPSSLAASVRSIAADLRRNAQALARHEPEALARMSADERSRTHRAAARPSVVKSIAARDVATRVAPPSPADADRFAALIPRVLEPSECAALIAAAEAAGFERSWFSAQRNRHAALDEGVAHRVWEGVRDHVPARLRGWRAARCNELLRTYRYEPGESFAKHEDDSSVVKGETSLLTVLVYLNDGFRGGATRLCKYRATDEGSLDITPVRGAAFVFEHSLLHEGMTPTEGVKYVMRSDVMYRAEDRPRSPGPPPVGSEATARASKRSRRAAPAPAEL